MKKITFLILSLWAVLFVVQPVYAGFITQPIQTATGKPSQKLHPQIAKLVEKVEKTAQKIGEKQHFLGKILKKHGGVQNKWLVPMLVFLIAAIVLAVIPIAGFGWIAYISYIGFVVFFFLWLLALLDVI